MMEKLVTNLGLLVVMCAFLCTPLSVHNVFADDDENPAPGPCTNHSSCNVVPGGCSSRTAPSCGPSNTGCSQGVGGGGCTGCECKDYNSSVCQCSI